MSNKWVGGSYTDGYRELWDYVARRIPGNGIEWKWERRGGLNTSGILVTTWGAVTARYYSPTNGAKWFYVDDGSHAVSDFGDIGVLIYSDADVKQGDFVSVTSIASVEPSFDAENRLVRVIISLNTSDVQVLKPYQPPQYPFSDEFDGPKLDLRWVCGTGISFTERPGWLIFKYFDGYLMQQAPGDWDMELRAEVVLPEYGGDITLTVSADDSSPKCWVKFSRSSGTWLLGAVMGNQSVASGLTPQPFCVRMRRRGPLCYASFSADCATYTPEVSFPLTSTGLLRIGTNGYSSSCKVALDYIRFSSVAQ